MAIAEGRTLLKELLDHATTISGDPAEIVAVAG